MLIPLSSLSICAAHLWLYKLSLYKHKKSDTGEDTQDYDIIHLKKNTLKPRQNGRHFEISTFWNAFSGIFFLNFD